MAQLSTLGSMSAHTEHTVSVSGGSYFIVAAWYSLLVPLLSPVILFLIFFGTEGRLGVASIAVFCILITSFISGICGLFGFSRHGRKLILWIAVIGTVASLVLGWFSYGFWQMLQGFHG